MNWRRVLIEFLLGVLLFFVGVEALLRAFDPWRVLAYYDDLEALYRGFEDTPHGYALRPGEYRFSSWTARILPDGTRLIQSSRSAGCKIVAVGDSVTFGYGVSDGDTWVSVLARALPGIQFVNAGVPGYNAEDVLRARQGIQGDAYLYLLIGNDNDPPLPWQSYQSLQGSAMAKYLYVQRAQVEGLPSGAQDEPSPAFDALLRDPAVITVAFKTDDFSKRLHERYPTLALIPLFRTTNSRVDSHPDAAGHAEIAAAMLPIIREAVTRACTAIL